MQQIVGHTAEQPLAQPEMAVSTHDNKVSLSPFSFCHQPGADLAVAALDPMKDGVDSMMLETVDLIDTEGRLFLGWALAGHDLKQADDQTIISLIIRTVLHQQIEKVDSLLPVSMTSLVGPIFECTSDHRF